MAKTILHIIDSLERGGAEILLKNSVNVLFEYCHLVVYLSGNAPLKSEFKGDVEFMCLNHERWVDLPSSVLKLRKIIRRKQPVLIHSHLFVSTLLARLAKPKSIPLFTTLHSIFSIDAFQKNRKSRWIERLTLRKEHTLIAVSSFVLDDYLKYVSFAGRRFVLYNFLPEDCFRSNVHSSVEEGLRCVAVGNLKEAKNYPYLLEVFSNLKDENISMDIFGEGYLRGALEKAIKEKGLRVQLCGKSNQINSVFKNYDLFIQASEHEGFGLSVIEAMASQIPVFVSDIPVFREVTSGYAHFFQLSSLNEATARLKGLIASKEERTKYTKAAFDYCLQHYSGSIYKEKLLSIYNSLLEGEKV